MRCGDEVGGRDRAAFSNSRRLYPSRLAHAKNEDLERFQAPRHGSRSRSAPHSLLLPPRSRSPRGISFTSAASASGVRLSSCSPSAAARQQAFLELAFSRQPLAMTTPRSATANERLRSLSLKVSADRRQVVRAESNEPFFWL